MPIHRASGISRAEAGVDEAGEVRHTQKKPYRDGTTQVVFDPLDFLARLALLVPRPQVNLTRFHGELAANAKWRRAMTPSGSGRGSGLAGSGAVPDGGVEDAATAFEKRRSAQGSAVA